MVAAVEWHLAQIRFEQFWVVFNFASADEMRQVSTLLYCLGEDVEEILEADEQKYVIQKFEKFFVIESLSKSTTLWS